MKKQSLRQLLVAAFAAALSSVALFADYHLVQGPPDCEIYFDDLNMTHGVYALMDMHFCQSLYFTCATGDLDLFQDQFGTWFVRCV